MRYVLDTSVVVKWFSSVSEGDLDNALKIRKDHLEKKIFLLCPDLMLYELTNVLRYKPRFDCKNIKKALESIELMGIDILPFSLKIANKSIELAKNYNITVYDSYFIALSESIHHKIIIADYKCYKKLKRIPHVIRLVDYR